MISIEKNKKVVDYLPRTKNAHAAGSNLSTYSFAADSIMLIIMIIPSWLVATTSGDDEEEEHRPHHHHHQQFTPPPKRGRASTLAARLCYEEEAFKQAVSSRLELPTAMMYQSGTDGFIV